jgi:hypothetical protein
MTNWPVHAQIDGPIVMILFGSIGKGTLPLIERHFNYDKTRLVGNSRHLTSPMMRTTCRSSRLFLVVDLVLGKVRQLHATQHVGALGFAFVNGFHLLQDRAQGRHC